VGGRKELKSDYNNYKLFGYDILLDQNMSPHLMEINARSLTSSLHGQEYIEKEGIKIYYQKGYLVKLKWIHWHFTTVLDLDPSPNPKLCIEITDEIATVWGEG
jgi:hypothetical protein